ncbi:pro-resilin-like [Procambarus clarkii]|uniref:pro-resilin-like n=1 Tax=Procambarus clarkii TaxID=6728 RepID=UPI0037425385
MSLKVILVAALAAVTMAELPPYNPPVNSYNPPPPSYKHPAPSYNPPAGNPKYDFNWKVKDDPSGNDFGHQESRDGYNTQGAYYVLLPDGRLQRVSYTVNGDSGYVAQVEYEGEAQYPAYQPSYKPSPSYQPDPSYKPTPTYKPTPVYA